MTFETIKHRFFELTQDRFWNGQEDEYESKVTCAPLKYHIFDFTQVAFLKKMSSQ